LNIIIGRVFENLVGIKLVRSVFVHREHVMINKHLFHFILDKNFHYFGVELWIFLEQEEVHLMGSVLVEYLSLFGEIVSKPIEEHSLLHLLEPVV